MSTVHTETIDVSIAEGGRQGTYGTMA